MNEYHRLSAVQLIEQNRKTVVAEIDPMMAGFQDHAIGLQNVQRIAGLRHGAFQIGQGKRGEKPETLAMSLAKPGALFIDAAGKCPGLDVVAEMHAGEEIDIRDDWIPSWSIISIAACSFHTGRRGIPSALP